MEPYFHRTERDAACYDELRERLPDVLFDAHQHVTLAAYRGTPPRELMEADWAMQCSQGMDIDDMDAYARALFPGIAFRQNAFGAVGRYADLRGGNAYIAELIRKGRIAQGMMVLDPDWDDEECERTLVEGGFAGFKPYPDLVAGNKGADISIFTFVPHSKLRILNRHRRALMLHIPRAGRLADDRNVAELKEMRDRYPEIEIIVAHYGRSYAPEVFREGARKLGPYMRELNFDTAAVLNPAVHAMALEVMDPKRILYGTDLPVFLWHGKRRWTQWEYFNLAREDFPWNRHEEGPEAEAGYTFFLYEQLRSILDAAEHSGGGRELAEDILHRNAEALFERIGRD